MKTAFHFAIGLMLLGVFAVGCRSPRNPSPYPTDPIVKPAVASEPVIIVVDPKVPRPLDEVLPEMIGNLVGSEAISDSPGNAVVLFAGVKNRSGEDFNLDLINRTIRDLLLRSGEVTLVGDRGPKFQAALDLLEYKPDDLVTRATARSLAGEARAHFLLVAEIHPAINQSVPGRYSQTCFRLALHLLSAETGEWAWNDEKDFRFRR